MKTWTQLEDDLTICICDLEALRALHPNDEQSIKIIDHCLQILKEDKQDVIYMDLLDGLYETNEGHEK